MNQPTNQQQELARLLVRDWLMGERVALTGVSGEAPPSLVRKFKVSLENRIATALSSRDQEIREVLEGLSYTSFSDGQSYRHWCGRREPCTPACLAARGLYEKLNSTTGK